MDKALVFERGDFVYLVGSVAPITPSKAEIEELAFSEQLQATAPNENLLWMRGQYVEGDKPNRNGQTWASEDLAIKNLSPRFMPVTIMHDPRTAVGLIADTKLLTPEEASVPRPRIDTVLAVWAHRFPEVAEEIAANYEQGTLMQSMECTAPLYDCLDCGKSFMKLPGGAERSNWCSHLKESAAAGEVPRRLLRDVTFTGTGLIFGTRNGATGALDTAHMEIAEEIANFHERAKSDRRTPRRNSVDTIEIKRSEYDELKAAVATASELAKRIETLEATAATVTELQKKLDAAELSQKAAEDKLAEETSKREQLEESARSETLSTERLSKLGTAFTAKLTDRIKTTLAEQAKSLTDEEWTARLDELSELVEVAHDAAAAAGDAGTVTAAETARTQLGGSASPATPSKAATATVLGGLLRSVRSTPPTTPAKK